VLLIDDDPDIRALVLDLLSDDGYAAAAVPNGQEALTYLRRVTQLPCLILLDLMMPRMNGVELARAARSRHPGLGVRLMTGHADADAVARSAGDLPLLRKPFRLAELAAEVREALAEAATASGGGVAL